VTNTRLSRTAVSQYVVLDVAEPQGAFRRFSDEKRHNQRRSLGFVSPTGPGHPPAAPQPGPGRPPAAVGVASSRVVVGTDHDMSDTTNRVVAQV
jgi:hypothetical protein